MKIRKNGKVITLSESDLRRIVKRVMNEGEDPIMNLEFLMCISEALNISITEMGDFKNCISCGTKISNGETPTQDEIMGCLSELETKIGEECTGNIIEKGMCIVENMALVMVKHLLKTKLWVEGS